MQKKGFLIGSDRVLISRAKGAFFRKFYSESFIHKATVRIFKNGCVTLSLFLVVHGQRFGLGKKKHELSQCIADPACALSALTDLFLPFSSVASFTALHWIKHCVPACAPHARLFSRWLVRLCLRVFWTKWNSLCPSYQMLVLHKSVPDMRRHVCRRYLQKKTFDVLNLRDTSKNDWAWKSRAWACQSKSLENIYDFVLAGCIFSSEII